MVLFIAAFLCLAGAVFIAAEIVTVPARERLESFQRARRYGRKSTRENREVALSLKERALVPLIERTAQLVLRVNPRMTVDAVSFRLLSAGLGRRVSPTAFLAAKGFLAVGGLVGGLLLGSPISGGLGVLLGLGAAALGYIAPDFWVSSRIKSRQERIRADLPDALDLLAVSVEAGLGFDAAVAKLTEQLEGPLGEEFNLTLSEMRIGESRQDALKKLSERTGIPEVTGFCRAIIQADQFGISLGRILRVQAVDARNRRQMAAEEKAMKAPIKMLFPTVVFIFPAMFVVVLGPAFLNISKIF